MKTTIEVNGLTLQAYHGVYDQERRVGNTFVVDVRLTVDMDERSLSADDIGVTVSYADIVAVVRDEMAVPSALLEHVAWRIRRRLVRLPALVVSGMVRVAKLTPPLGVELDSAAVRLDW